MALGNAFAQELCEIKDLQAHFSVGRPSYFADIDIKTTKSISDMGESRYNPNFPCLSLSRFQ
jgi:hypothetical protein